MVMPGRLGSPPLRPWMPSARHREPGLTADKIRRIFVGRELGPQQPLASSGVSTGVPGKGMMSCVTNNLTRAQGPNDAMSDI